MKRLVSQYSGTLNVNPGLVLCDMTLREGEMTPGVALSIEEKKQLVRKLDEIGIHQIQIANVGFSKQLIHIAKEICNMRPKAKTELMSSGMQDAWEEAINVLLECDSDIIHAGFPVTPYINPELDETKKSRMRDRVCQIVQYVRKNGKLCNISLNDAPRADLEFLQELVEIASREGAYSVRLADTVGVASPEAMERIVSACVKIAEPYGTKIGVHCHNDFGLALADSFASINAGATLVDVCINGLGDRCGNTSLEQLAITAAALYDTPIEGIKLDKLLALSKLGEQLTGIPVGNFQPFTGKYAFSADMEDHIKRQSEFEFAFQGILPEEIGAQRVYMYGKNTGPFVIQLAAQRTGVQVSDDLIPYIAQALYDLDERMKGQPLFEKEFLQAVEQAKMMQRAGHVCG